MINRGDIKLAIDMVVNAQDDSLWGGEAEYVINTLEDCGNTIAAQVAEISQLKEQVKFVQSENFRTQAVSAQTFPTSAGDGDENTGIPDMYHESRNCIECLNKTVDLQAEKINAQAAVIEFQKDALKTCEETIDIVWVSHHANRCDDALEHAREALAIPTDSTQILAEVRRAERERVAQFVENQRNDIPMTGIECAAAIRAME